MNGCGWMVGWWLDTSWMIGMIVEQLVGWLNTSWMVGWYWMWLDRIIVGQLVGWLDGVGCGWTQVG